MGNLFHTFLTQPLFNALIWLYNIIPGQDMGFAIIALTVLVKLALWPPTHASLKSQKRLQELQPKVEELKAQYKDDKEGFSKAMIELYGKEKVNPFSSCLPLLIQLPILIALYKVLLSGLNSSSLSDLYPFIKNPEVINTQFLGWLDLTKKSIPLALIAGILQYFQAKMLMTRHPPKVVAKKPEGKDEDVMASVNKSMIYVMPAMTVFIGIGLPGGLALYWVAITVVTIFQQFVAFKQKKQASESSVTPSAPANP
jgi:YidC/Oxa1 family membrane protein insertase